MNDDVFDTTIEYLKYLKQMNEIVEDNEGLPELIADVQEAALWCIDTTEDDEVNVIDVVNTLIDAQGQTDDVLMEIHVTITSMCKTIGDQKNAIEALEARIKTLEDRPPIVYNVTTTPNYFPPYKITCADKISSGYSYLR